MNQPIPDVGVKDVNRISHRDYPSAANEALAILSRYGAEPYHQESARVQVAILKLAGGSFEKLHSMTSIACDDFRDVLSWAEYPEYSKRAIHKFTLEEKRRIIEADWKQYYDWIKE